ncbi:MAG: biopolymer transporter ExbD [Bdellovibrionales bacterium]|nr:biopolymer transporter ExbD [Bdellovibrionales bacterium]
MSRSREANFEINLLPVISLLAVCISFLLVTAVWIHIGTMDVSQAVGPQKEDATPNPPSLQIRMDGRGRMILSIKDAPTWRGTSEFAIGNAAGDVDWNAFDQAVSSIQGHLPELKTVLIFPSAEFRYRDLVKMMDGIKKKGLPDIGISPL